MSEARAVNMKTGQPIPIRLVSRMPQSRGVKVERHVERRHRENGNTSGATIGLPDAIVIAKKMTRSPKRQAGLLLGYLIADAVVGMLRGR